MPYRKTHIQKQRISSWLEPVMFVKQIQTANICLNVERYCISVIFRAKVGPPWTKIILSMDHIFF